jgi:hypothetical protein
MTNQGTAKDISMTNAMARSPMPRGRTWATLHDSKQTKHQNGIKVINFLGIVTDKILNKGGRQQMV